MSSLQKYFSRDISTGRCGELREKSLKKRRFILPTHTHTGEPLNWFQRLFYGWFYSFDEELARTDRDLTRAGGR